MFSFFAPAAVLTFAPSRLLEYEVHPDGQRLLKRSRALALIHRGHHSSCLAGYSIFAPDFQLDADSNEPPGHGSRAAGALLGLACGDALAASGTRGELLGLERGQWTEQTSTTLCVADSLLCLGALSVLDVKHRWALWWFMGYCTPIDLDEERPSRVSFGLQGALAESLHDFTQTGAATPSALCGTDGASAPAPAPSGLPLLWAAAFALFAPDWREAARDARALSLSVDPSADLAEGCGLAAVAVWRCLRREAAGDTAGRDALTGLEEVPVASQDVRDIAHSAGPWDWQAEGFGTDEHCRPPQPLWPLGVALHSVWAGGAPAAALARAAALEEAAAGDGVAVALTGLLAGAAWGEARLPAEWVAAVQRWDPGQDIALRARCLLRRVRVEAHRCPGHEDPIEEPGQAGEAEEAEEEPEEQEEEEEDGALDADGLDDEGYDPDFAGGDGFGGYSGWEEDGDGATPGGPGWAAVADPWATEGDPAGDPEADVTATGDRPAAVPDVWDSSDDDATPGPRPPIGT